MARRRQGSLQDALIIAAAILVLAFLVLMFLGDYRFWPALFMSLLIALLSGIVIYLGFGGAVKLPAAAPAAATKPAPVPAAAPAAVATSEPAPAPTPAPAPQPAPAPKPAPAAKAEAKPKSKPAAKASTKAEAAPAAAAKPKGLKSARGGKADDLKQIKGVGPKLEKLLHSMGYFHFDQIADWTKAEIGWVDENLEGFKGRATRDKWVEQAKSLAKGGRA